jgi:hypothetical protein
MTSEAPELHHDTPPPLQTTVTLSVQNTPNTYHFFAQYVKASCHPAAPPSRHETGQRHVSGLTIAIYDRPKLTENPQYYTKMSGWGLGWFGGGQTKKEAPKKAILQLRGQLEMLNKREKHLQNQMDEQDALARKHVSTNKQGSFGSHPVESTANLLQRRSRRYGGRSSSSTPWSRRAHRL